MEFLPEGAPGKRRKLMTFDYKNGENYTCVLCGEKKHTHGPQPDKLCDGCWELKTRIESQPKLAQKVLFDLEAK